MTNPIESYPLQRNPGETTRVDQEVDLEAFLAEALPIVSDLEECNRRLVEAGRSDLVITEHAKLKKIDDPEEFIGNSGNFKRSFSFRTARLPAEDDTKYSRPRFVPITEEQLAGLADGSFAYDPRQLTIAGDASELPSFQRMHALFPEITRALVLKLTYDEDYLEYEEKFYKEEFTLYQIMSRLVDKKDRGMRRVGNVMPSDHDEPYDPDEYYYA